QRGCAHARKQRIGAVAALLDGSKGGKRLVGLVLVGKRQGGEEFVAAVAGLIGRPVAIAAVGSRCEDDEHSEAEDGAPETTPHELQLVGSKFLVDLTDEAVVVECHSRLRRLRNLIIRAGCMCEGAFYSILRLM